MTPAALLAGPAILTGKLGFSAPVATSVGALLFAAVYLAALPRPLYLGGAVPVLLAWGLSESQLTRLRSRIDREGTLLAAVEGCNGSELENCRRIRDEVWRLAFEAAGVREAT